jgi:hypothetical protein
MSFIARFWAGMLGPPVDSAALLRHVAHGPGPRLAGLAKPLPTEREPDWVIVCGGEVIGRLWDDVEESDFPWNICLFEPTPAFERWQALFETLRSTLEAARYDRAREIAQQVEQSGIKVVWPHDPAMPDLAMALQISGQWAWFRNRPRSMRR